MGEIMPTLIDKFMQSPIIRILEGQNTFDIAATEEVRSNRRDNDWVEILERIKLTCQLNCENKYRVRSPYLSEYIFIEFENIRDAVLFKLKYY
jgi:hypothetical protein